jgi:uncharacterized protein (DUF488 family)
MTREPRVRLVTVGHGTASAEDLAALLSGAGIELVVDVRSAPGSRRHPQFGRAELERWLPAAGIAYRWEPDLGGFRRPRPDSTNVGLRHPGFRGYADYMETPPFREALRRVLEEASERVVAVMCAESVWWRCHRRLIADAAVALFGAEVVHLGHDGRLSAHEPNPGLVVVDEGLIRYTEAPRADDRPVGRGGPSSP